MARDYELMYIVRPDLDDEAVTAATQSVQTIIEGQGGEVVATTSWGKRRLAYEIERLRDGHYMLLHIRLDGDRVREIERLLSIHDSVFRHMLTVYVDDGTGAGEGPAASIGQDDGEHVGSPARGGRAGAADGGGEAPVAPGVAAAGAAATDGSGDETPIATVLAAVGAAPADGRGAGADPGVVGESSTDVETEDE